MGDGLIGRRKKKKTEKTEIIKRKTRSSLCVRLCITQHSREMHVNNSNDIIGPHTLFYNSNRIKRATAVVAATGPTLYGAVALLSSLLARNVFVVHNRLENYAAAFIMIAMTSPEFSCLGVSGTRKFH